MEDMPKEACGVFGAYDFGHRPIFSYLYWGLVSQNHRGHQSYGFLTFDGSLRLYRDLGLVPGQRYVKRLPGYCGIANVRYTTSGSTEEHYRLKNAQPSLAKSGKMVIGLSFNGNIVNTAQLREDLGKEPSCNTELICEKLLHGLEGGDLESSIRDCMKDVEGSFSVVGLDQSGRLFAFRDPLGIKPLCCGYGKNGRVFAMSSESVGLDINGFQYGCEIGPGYLFTLSKEGIKGEQLVRSNRGALCAFEFAYFARPDSVLYDESKPVYRIREEFGRNLGRENPDICARADIIISIPETANDAAYGLHEEFDIPWSRAMRRHRYVTERAFILLEEERHATIDKKINILPSEIGGKKVILVDDSKVRGDTTRTIVRKLRAAGAAEIHEFITFPRIISPCFYGIDMATYGELIGARYGPDEIAEIIGVDSLSYQSIDGFVRATGLRRDQLCLGCITGRYPTPLAQKMADRMRERFERGYRESKRIYEGD
jgi:amidophosphoribosyltransferase